MTRFIIEQTTEQPDRIYVEVYRRFEIVVIRTKAGLELRVYPRTGGELWDYPFTKVTVDEAEAIALAVADGLLPPVDQGGGQ